MLEYLKLFARSGVAANAWWLSRVEDQIGSWEGDPKKIAAVGQTWKNLAGQVCKVACAFVSIVDIPEQLFACCESPKAVAADGIVLSVQSKHLSHLKQPWVWRDAPSSAKARATNPVERTLPCSDDERSLLYALVDREANLADLEEALANGTLVSNGPRAAVILALAYHSGCSQHVGCPQGALDVVRCMLRDISPAIQLLPSRTWQLVESHMITPDSPSFTMDLFLTLSKYSPIMMRLLNCARNSKLSTRSEAVTVVTKVFRDLLRISRSSTSAPIHLGPAPGTLPAMHHASRVLPLRFRGMLTNK